MIITRLSTWTCAAVLTLCELSISPLAWTHAQEQTAEVSKDVLLTIPPKWSRSAAKYRNALQLVSPPVEAQKEKGVQAVMTITSEHRRNHEEAVQRLAEIAVEIHTSVEFIEIGGWPALQRQYTVPLER